MEDKKEPLTYSSYLKVRDLLNLQKPLSEPVAHDEMLFIIIHQTYELWFKQIIFEADSLIEALNRDDQITSYRRLERINEIFKVLVQQVDILETMTPVDFNRFRSHLNPASGFQSLQFRELELLAGIEPGAYDKFAKLEPEWQGKLERRKQGPSLRSTFLDLLRRKGLLRASDPDSVEEALYRIYTGDAGGSPELVTLCEHLIRFDELFSLWRFRHVQMVERMIGLKRGTGGSLGVKYLQATVAKRFFPELWHARTRMGDAGEYGGRG